MSHTPSDFFDTDGRPTPHPAVGSDSDRKLKVWAVLNAVEQGLLSAADTFSAYGISPAELEEHRAGWLDFEAGSR